MFAVKSILVTFCKVAVNYSMQFPTVLQRNISQYLSKKLAPYIPSCLIIAWCLFFSTLFSKWLLAHQGKSW